MTENTNEQIIRETAYYLWLDAGKPEGSPDGFWYTAIEKINSPQKDTLPKTRHRKK